MRLFILIITIHILGLAKTAFAQTPDSIKTAPVDSASSNWKFVIVTPKLKSPVYTPLKVPTKKLFSDAKLIKHKPAVTTFSDSFETNRYGWLTASRNGYAFAITNSSYSIRRLPSATQESGRCYIRLPAHMDLNKAESFTISVDMTVEPGQALEGGLLMGVKDVNNLTQFSFVDKSFLIIKSLRNGQTFANYMPGTPSPASVPVRKDRNTLMVNRQKDKLHFYINGQEIESSPYDFHNFNGTGIGFIVGKSAVKFQNLFVRVSPLAN